MPANDDNFSAKRKGHHPSNPQETRKPVESSAVPQKTPITHRFIGKMIALARQELNWTQPDLADKSGYDLKTIQNVEGGKTKKPDTLRDLRDFLVEKLANENLPSLEELLDDNQRDLPTLSKRSAPSAVVARPENPTEFILATNKQMPQWADHRELNLGGGRLGVLKCRITTKSPYFRFGFKLHNEDERLFGDGSIKSQDANLLVHVGRNNWNRPNLGISAKDIFFTWYLNGISLETDAKLFSAGHRVSASVELRIDSSYVATFSVNGVCYLNRVIPPGICRRITVLAWGDREEYAVEVSELSVNSA